LGKKDKKGKKGKKKDKKKGKKGRPLPGEKLCASMELEQMLGILVEHGVICTVKPTKIDDLVGEFNYLGSAYQQHSEVKDIYGDWVPQDPSMSQIRQNITEHIILPLGCSFLRIAAPYAKSVLLYGPSGSGKTMLTKAVAHHTGAIFVNLSPKILEKLPRDLRETKGGPTKLIHMAFAVARHPSFGPGLIYIDEIDKIFVGKKKVGGGDAMRFRKDLVAYANSLKPEERCVIIGCTSKPFSIPDGELKDIKSVFEKQLYMPFPNYPSRVQLWRLFLEEGFGQYKMGIPDEFDLSSLAFVSEGYSAGSLRDAVKKTLTERRMSKSDPKSITEKDFVSALSSCPMSYQEDNLKFQQFTATITGLNVRRSAIRDLKESEGDGKDKKAKKK